MYTITRQQAAETLNISTRSIDRYIKSGKLRAKKEGKIIYIHESDIHSLGGNGTKKHEVIMPKIPKKTETSHTTTPSTEMSGSLEKIYVDLRAEIQKKDHLIQNLSLQLGEAKEIAKNSISLVEFKKSQFLLEESKGYLNKEVEVMRDKNDELQEKLKYEKGTNMMLIVFVVILFIILGLIWFIKI